MKAPKLLLGGLILLSTQGFSQTDTTKTPKDTTTKKDISFVSILDTVPGKRDTTTKRDTSKWIAYNVLDTVPKKDTSDKKKDLSFNYVAKGPFVVEDAYIVLDTIPGDTAKKTSAWGSLAPIPQAQPLSEFKSSAPAPNAGKYYVAVLGTYQPENTTTTANETQPSATTTTTAGSNVTITVDEQNPGKIWVSGIGDDKFYAYLKSDANIYKIPAQKVSDKKSISEGIVSYNETSKEVHIRIGSGFNDADPTASLNGTQATASAEMPAEKPMKKGKTSHAVAKAPVKKVISFDGIKTDAGTASL
ncbi:hypothetical protein [Pinibacter soli]|uniref:Uncharacterized protein n=1 Tax=Pinibacter soli TaxID=3044211 RepID=A0ABT6RJ68_9BACT|nr:hypothetical protein [Pinibacter soli]MDI3322616.1 hypothetical protein [Pinibacter soli]